MHIFFILDNSVSIIQTKFASLYDSELSRFYCITLWANLLFLATLASLIFSSVFNSSVFDSDIFNCGGCIVCANSIRFRIACWCRSTSRAQNLTVIDCSIFLWIDSYSGLSLLAYGINTVFTLSFWINRVQVY